ncbi:MAG: hypothetical protein JW882_06160 [Deltaproteobacteria bacterium]|nr:hypothetical protein [Deltaproteobacteria bacterium]
MWSDHKRIEERSIALHREIARRIYSTPALIRIAKRNIESWAERNGETPIFNEWREILDRPLDEIIEVLVSVNERGRRLRQSSPFCGILTPQERWKIYESFTTGTYYQGSGKRSG